MAYLKDLEENKSYTITFDVNEVSSRQKIHCVKVLIKLDNSIKLANIDTEELKWHRTSTMIVILDEVPEKYFRKEKLKKLEELNEQQQD